MRDRPIYQKRRKTSKNRPNAHPAFRPKSRFTISKNNAVRSSKYQPAMVWSKCFACNKDLWTNRLSYDVWDNDNRRFESHHVCNSQRCINLLILQEL